jgi:hypothetical protein
LFSSLVGTLCVARAPSIGGSRVPLNSAKNSDWSSPTFEYARYQEFGGETRMLTDVRGRRLGGVMRWSNGRMWNAHARGSLRDELLSMGARRTLWMNCQMVSRRDG